MVRHVQSLLIVVFIFIFLLQLISLVAELKIYAEINYPQQYQKTLFKAPQSLQNQNFSKNKSNTY